MTAEPFEFQNRTVRIGRRTYPTVMQEDRPDGYQQAMIPMENGNIVHIDHTPEGHKMRQYGDHPYAITTNDPDDDYFFQDSEEGIHAKLHELATKKLHPDEVKNNQRVIRRYVTGKDPWEDRGS